MREKKRSDYVAIILNMVWGTIAVVVNYLINFLITPYVTNNIGIEAYGFVSLATTFTNYIDIISIALNAFAARYISITFHQGDIKKTNEFFSSVIIANVVLALLVIIPSGFVISKLNYFINIPNNILIDVKILFIVILIKYLLTIMRTAFNVATFIKNRLDISERQKTISYVIQGGILLSLCVFLNPHVWYVGVAGVISALYLLIVNMIYCNKLTPELKFRMENCSWKSIKELVSSGIWNAINNLGNVLNSGLDLLITNIMLSALAMGQISIAKNIATICYTLLSTISNSFKPRQLKTYSLNNIEELTKQLKNSMKVTSMICNLILALFIACGYSFLKLWIPNQNIEFIYNITCIVLLGDIMVGIVNPLYYVFTLTTKLKLPCIITIAMGFMNVIAMFILIKFTTLGAYAVVLTTLILNFIHFIDTPLYSAYCLKIPLLTFYPTILRHFLSCGIIVVGVKATANILPVPSGWITLILVGVVCGIVGLLLSIITMYNPKEMQKKYIALRKES